VYPGVLNPRVSFLDPRVTMTLSTAQTAYACTDILSHLMEAYFTTPAERLPVQDHLIEGVARGTVEAMSTIMKRPADYDARAAFMWAATLGWSGICQAGIPDPTMPSHALEMPLSAVYDIAHGAGLSVVIPAWIEQAGARHQKRILGFFKAVFNAEPGALDAAATQLRHYYRTIGSPVTLAEAGVPNPNIDRLVALASRAFVQRKMTDYTEDLIETIYRACL
jgi:alcohol dehydrogenase YqhD (iron-dependent ADH family)